MVSSPWQPFADALLFSAAPFTFHVVVVAPNPFWARTRVRPRPHIGFKGGLYSRGKKFETLSYPHQGEDLCLKHCWKSIFFYFMHFKKPRMALYWEWCYIVEGWQNLTNFGILARTFFQVLETSKLDFTGVVASQMMHDFKYEPHRATLRYLDTPLKKGQIH